jgi:hypothetical protein
MLEAADVMMLMDKILIPKPKLKFNAKAKNLLNNYASEKLGMRPKFKPQHSRTVAHENF